MEFKPISAVHGIPFQDGYKPPLGLPVYWMDDVSGALPSAVKAYIGHQADPANEALSTKEQLELLAAYIRYYINAPCWNSNLFFTDELVELRVMADGLQTVDDIEEFISAALDISLDPL